MIQIEAIHIEEFRGIRQLDLALASKSFVVFGPNGSGKSGVVDAIDFALTGTIARLSGPGTSGLTVLKFGPHVHQRDNAGAATGVADPPRHRKRPAGSTTTPSGCTPASVTVLPTTNTPDAARRSDRPQDRPPQGPPPPPCRATSHMQRFDQLRTRPHQPKDGPGATREIFAPEAPQE
jgi:hypothetical protein